VGGAQEPEKEIHKPLGLSPSRAGQLSWSNHAATRPACRLSKARSDRARGATVQLVLDFSTCQNKHFPMP
jgi:hypothetical protein